MDCSNGRDQDPFLVAKGAQLQLECSFDRQFQDPVNQFPPSILECSVAVSKSSCRYIASGRPRKPGLEPGPEIFAAISTDDLCGGDVLGSCAVGSVSISLRGRGLRVLGDVNRREIRVEPVSQDN